MTMTIEPESPRQPEVLALIEELDRYQGELYPAQSNHLLAIDALCAADIRFFVARIDHVVVGCGALRVFADYAELKRMFVSPGARGTQLGARILARLEEQALSEDLVVVRLETGIHQPAALALYKASGYRERAAFGDYQPDPLSVFMEKRLARIPR